jgi:RNA polymerase sigma factor (sigma-70 family)
VKAGEFEEIINLTKQIVLAAISRTLSPKLVDHIDDVVQETYFRAFKKLKKTNKDNINSMEAYLYTIAKNEAQRLNKKEAKFISLAQELQKDFEINTCQEDEMVKEMNAIINQLPPQHKAIIDLFRQGFSLKEIAQKFEIKLGTVKSRLFRTRQMIENKMRGKLV